MMAVLIVGGLLIYFLLTSGILNRNGTQVQVAPEEMEAFRSSEESLIMDRMTYYTLLEEDEKKKFLMRTRLLMDSLAFVSREEGFEVTDEMRVLVSASLAQLSFGWTELKPPHLEQIDLFSESFYSRLAGADVKGLTLPNRVMLSWRYFQEGDQIDNDKVNLGLHELAHSIWDETYEDDKIQAELDRWIEVANVEFQKMQRHIDSGFFRDYAATNTKELWACSVECFFEAPIEFQQKIPDLYNAVAEIINQDMVERMQRKPFVRSWVAETTQVLQ